MMHKPPGLGTEAVIGYNAFLAGTAVAIPTHARPASASHNRVPASPEPHVATLDRQAPGDPGRTPNTTRTNADGRESQPPTSLETLETTVQRPTPTALTTVNQ